MRHLAFKMTVIIFQIIVIIKVLLILGI